MNEPAKSTLDAFWRLQEEMYGRGPMLRAIVVDDNMPRGTAVRIEAPKEDAIRRIFGVNGARAWALLQGVGEHGFVFIVSPEVEAAFPKVQRDTPPDLHAISGVPVWHVRSEPAYPYALHGILLSAHESGILASLAGPTAPDIER
jgi:hypothetical protein